MSKESYARGFVKAATSAGVDPTALAKYAEATPVTDVLAGYPGAMLLSAIPGGGLVGPGAYIAGLASDEDNTHRDASKALIPGVSSYRMGNRIKTQVMRELRDIEKDDKHKGARPVAHAIAEHLGGGTSALAASGIGAALGAALGGGKGALIGGGVGAGAAGVAALAASIAAAIKRRRTKEEQIESDKKSILMKYLVPGISSYDYYKRIGRSQGERDEDKNNKKDK